MKKFLALITFSFVCMFSLNGCDFVSELTAPKFDATSPQTFEDSYTKMRDKLTESERDQLDKALIYISASYLADHPKDTLVAGAAALLHDDIDNSVTKSFGKDLMKTFDGKTAKQVIREYEEMKNK